MVTGRYVTSILHFINQAPIYWYSKKQVTAETATYGSEFVAGHTCVLQLIDIRTTIRYLGVPIIEPSHMFGDNESVVNSSENMDSKRHKRHNALSFHRVRESIAASICCFHYLPGRFNPADITSKHWLYNCVWKEILRPLLFWFGDTVNIAMDTWGFNIVGEWQKIHRIGSRNRGHTSQGYPYLTQGTYRYNISPMCHT